MVQFTTKSGATYEVDEGEKKFRRVGPHSDGIIQPDEEWHEFEYMSQITKGVGVYFLYAGGEKARMTTEVVNIER